MKELFVKDLERYEGALIEEHFLVIKAEIKELREQKGNFIWVILGDKTGRIEGVVFENTEKLRDILKRGKVVRVKGLVGRFNNNLRIKIENAEVLEDFEKADFIPVTPENRVEMLKELKQYLTSVKNIYLRKLAEEFLKDREFLQSFIEAPAAKMYHHNYLGGLLEHTLNIVRLADALGRIYKSLDRDILILGAFLHDIGKTREYTLFPEIEQTDIGKLLGHIILGYEITQSKIEVVKKKLGKFPEELRYRLLHIILSHHGELSKGSPVEPHTLEAQIIHFLDYLDAREWMFREAQKHPAEPGAHWSEYSKPLRKSIYIGIPEDENQTEEGGLF